MKFKHSKVLNRMGDLVFCLRLDEEGKGSTIAPRWYTVRLVDEEPDWTSVCYHDCMNEGMRRLGLTNWVHPDCRGKPDPWRALDD